MLYCIWCTGRIYATSLPIFGDGQIHCQQDGVHKGGTYKIVGKSCDGAHNLTMLHEVYGPDVQIVEAYSDKAEPMLDAAEKAYRMREGVIIRHQKK